MKNSIDPLRFICLTEIQGRCRCSYDRTFVGSLLGILIPATVAATKNKSHRRLAKWCCLIQLYLLLLHVVFMAPLFYPAFALQFTQSSLNRFPCPLTQSRCYGRRRSSCTRRSRTWPDSSAPLVVRRRQASDNDHDDADPITTPTTHSIPGTSESTAPPWALQFRIHHGIRDIPASDWNACVNYTQSPLPSMTIVPAVEENDDNRLQNHGSDADDHLHNRESQAQPKPRTTARSPFCQYEWIHALEETGCASASTGWYPHHVEIRLETVASTPARPTSEESPNRDDTTTSASIRQPSMVPKTLGEMNDNDSSILLGFVPLYLKTHSRGEFVFDQSWAEAAYRSGLSYYPKLLAAIPFTPATGPRILWHPQVEAVVRPVGGHGRHGGSRETEIPRSDRGNVPTLSTLRRTVGALLRQLAAQNEISSVHFNFVLEEEASDLAGPLKEEGDETGNRDSPFLAEASRDDPNGSLRKLLRKLQGPQPRPDRYLRRTSLQYHWTNANPNNHGQPFSSFDDYLNCFKSKRRITIKRERRKVLEDAGIRIDAIAGREILTHPGLVERMFEIYLSTIEKMAPYGQQYLTLDFFRTIAQTDFIENLCFVCARQRLASVDDIFRSNDVFAGTVNIVQDGIFYGRYWGSLPEFDEVKNLHFEACYWQAIEYCIKKGYSQMQPGAGGGDYKYQRGFDPALCHSVHFITNPGFRRVVGQFLDYETENNVEVTEYLRQRSAVGGGGYASKGQDTPTSD